MIITKDILDRYYSETFDLQRFIANDPCGSVYQLMEHTDRQLDIEIGALLVAMISWGSRKVICPTALHMLRDEMRWHPARFIMDEEYEHAYADAKNGCVYRTLNVETFRQVCRNLRAALSGHDTMEQLFCGMPTKQVIATICQWLAPAKIGTMDKSACKRVCMFVRWMTRATSPDLNIWRTRPQSDLYAVMDTHVIQLTSSLLQGKRPTWRTCEELTSIFKSWDAEDPLKYDIALMTMADHQEG